MDRLTGKHYDRGDYYMVCSGSCDNDDEMCGGCPWLEKIINRLGSYEDTGLEPEDMKMAFDEEAILKLAAQCLQTTPARLRELAQSEQDGRLVVLPCKVGDTVYAAETAPVVPLYVTHVGVWLDGADGGDWEDLKNIGKTVFLTREEAEAALKGCDEE